MNNTPRIFIPVKYTYIVVSMYMDLRRLCPCHNTTLSQTKDEEYQKVELGFSSHSIRDNTVAGLRLAKTSSLGRSWSDLASGFKFFSFPYHLYL